MGRVQTPRPTGITRRHIMYDHGKHDGLQGLFSIIGGVAAYNGDPQGVAQNSLYQYADN